MINTVIQEIFPGIPDIRHEFHSRPELAFEENITCSLIRDILSGMDLTILPPFLGTDTVCLFDGPSPGPTILLRADIDALPITENSGKKWSSRNPGAHHACGHDGHMAMLIGCIMALLKLREHVHGRIVFVFQPAEEGNGGGKHLIDAGLFDMVGRPDAAFALHGWPGLPSGVLHTRPGPLMAAQDRFYIDIHGVGGHGAMPHVSRDPIVAAASLITALQSVVSRERDPRTPSVLSVCNIHGGTAENIIPESVLLSGTTRYFDPNGRSFFKKRIGDITKMICRSHRCEGEIRYEFGYIPLVNDARAVNICSVAVEKHLGSGRFIADGPMYLTAEDFAYYLDAVPGAMLLLGLGKDWPHLHSPEFDFDDSVLCVGIKALTGTALEAGETLQHVQ